MKSNVYQQSLQDRLAESTDLVSRHVASLAEHEKREQDLATIIKERDLALEDVKAALDEKAKQLSIEEQTHGNALKLWTEKVLL